MTTTATLSTILLATELAGAPVHLDTVGLTVADATALAAAGLILTYGSPRYLAAFSVAVAPGAFATLTEMGA